MDRFTQPHVLDPNRLLINDLNEFTADHEAMSTALKAALDETCEYAQQLWEELDAVRHYLIDAAPQDPRISDGPVRSCATPSGPDDDEGWTKWSSAYARVTTLLAGPNGDSGYGEQEAAREQRDRRLAATAERDQPDDEHAPAQTTPDVPVAADGGAADGVAVVSAAPDPRVAAAPANPTGKGPGGKGAAARTAAAVAASLAVGRLWGARSRASRRTT
jgi:hypothetical protein